MINSITLPQPVANGTGYGLLSLLSKAPTIALAWFLTFVEAENCYYAYLYVKSRPPYLIGTYTSQDLAMLAGEEALKNYRLYRAIPGNAKGGRA